MREQGTKWRILRYLNTREEASAEEMRREFGLGMTTLREHIYDLKERELIHARKQPGQGRGRPTHYYQLTRKAEETFPQASDNLSQMLYRILRRSLDKETLDQTLEELLIEYLQETNRQIKDLLREHGYEVSGEFEKSHG